MTPGLRKYRGASLRVAIPEALPSDMWEKVREISGVVSYSPRRGEASGLMHQVCAEADRSGLSLMLMPDSEALQRFYNRFGFDVVQVSPCLMLRTPCPRQELR